ncbi:phosphoesterase, PA-phosphatase related protein [Candidatus Koribacter versatilis Ellin345]|uniref:Phosphoesterase, PA-phosphatase related protein n=1 Tax=Koribacter versatilis (strain Ellin345) TaxID=204669 RepID=Q1IPI3_KORVE|nr:phosphatase PAP2 family protein [Candidatus Koribacter versatilis]ABF41217.1 phosphoesterase, PA-phosphatase related protein [Candidatus Koribacter versatilis Ellin345]
MRNQALLVLFLLLSFGVSLAQDATPAAPCSLGPFGRNLGRGSKAMLHGVVATPRNMIRPKNLLWELPVAGAITALAVTDADQRAVDHFKSTSTEKSATKWSDIGIGVELGAGAIGWIAGCATDKPSLANNTVTALVAAGYGQLINLAAKETFRRQYPYSSPNTGDFFYRSRAGSFPSGHATTGFAFAAAISRKYPHNLWVAIGSYGLATAVSVARVPAKKHYPSDLLMGAALGWATGTYIANHTP